MRYIIGLLIGIGLIVLTFILIFKAFSGPGAPKTQTIDLNSYATTDAVVRVTFNGPVTYNSSHQSIRITVGADQVLYEQIQGYQGTLVKSQTYPNNRDAYAVFLRALNFQGFTKGDPSKPKDERGYCPLGRTYVYEGLTGGDNIFRWWNDSCTANEGNFLGQGGTIRQLFTRQVPDYNTISRGVSL